MVVPSDSSLRRQINVFHVVRQSLSTLLGCVVFVILLFLRKDLMPGFDTWLVLANSVAITVVVTSLLQAIMCGVAGVDYCA